MSPWLPNRMYGIPLTLNALTLLAPTNLAAQELYYQFGPSIVSREQPFFEIFLLWITDDSGSRHGPTK